MAGKTHRLVAAASQPASVLAQVVTGCSASIKSTLYLIFYSIPPHLLAGAPLPAGVLRAEACREGPDIKEEEDAVPAEEEATEGGWLLLLLPVLEHCRHVQLALHDTPACNASPQHDK